MEPWQLDQLVIILAIRADQPPDPLYQAAAIDGAPPGKVFSRHIQCRVCKHVLLMAVRAV